LGFKTPNEVFMQSLNRVALRVWIYGIVKDSHKAETIRIHAKRKSKYMVTK
jgi:hypothetical protein